MSSIIDEIEASIWVLNPKSAKITITTHVQKTTVSKKTGAVSRSKSLKLVYFPAKEKYYISPDYYLRRYTLNEIKEI